MTNRTPNLEIHFLSLHLGYRRNQILGPSNVQAFLNDIQQKHTNDTKVILFNTGLHEIYQFCGADNAADGRTYINTTVLDSGTFSCTFEYRNVLMGLNGGNPQTRGISDWKNEWTVTWRIATIRSALVWWVWYWFRWWSRRPIKDTVSTLLACSFRPSVVASNHCFRIVQSNSIGSNDTVAKEISYCSNENFNSYATLDNARLLGVCRERF